MFMNRFPVNFRANGANPGRDSTTVAVSVTGSCTERRNTFDVHSASEIASSMVDALNGSTRYPDLDISGAVKSSWLAIELYQGPPLLLLLLLLGAVTYPCN